MMRILNLDDALNENSHDDNTETPEETQQLETAEQPQETVTIKRRLSRASSWRIVTLSGHISGSVLGKREAEEDNIN